MLYVLYGTDNKRSRAKMHELLENLTGRKPDASVLYIDHESFDPAALDTFISGQGLFESKQVVVLDMVFKNIEARDVLLSRRKELKASPNIFFLLEGELTKALLSKLEKVAEKVECFGESLKKEKRARAFNTFALGDALGERDRKTLWVLYHKARLANVSDEEIHGVLFWQAKSMALAQGADTADDAGLNPFVYRKARSFVKNYSKEEVHDLLRTLVRLSHDARRGIHEFPIALERFVLGV